MKTISLKRLSAATLVAMGMCATPALAEPTLEISGAVEVEFNTGDDHTSATSGDIALATVALNFDAQINNNVSAHIVVLHEDDDTDPPVIDTGIISITNDSMFMNAGRMFIPFGNFESHMVSDPLTLEIAETQEAVIEVGYEADGLRASVYAFNGGADKNEADNDVVDDFGISIGYNMKMDSMSLDLGFDYINNMAETDSIEGTVIGGGPGGGTIEEHTAGIALHAIINMDALTVIFEHITAADDFNTADLDFNGENASPSATNLELAYTMNMGDREMTMAVAHQRTSDIDASALPESRNMISVSTTIVDDVGFAVEYSSASDYETADGGTGESGGMLTAQLAVEF
ncbi:MAG: LbtU family siderophore porin [Gammaproteobacteria bacterium]|nr:LbtU family siderophore porin [Gammaproteobacteria bacterium]